MPMPIQSLEEFNKVLNVSWYHPEKPVDEQVYVYIQVLFTPPVRTGTNLRLQFPMCLAIFANVSLMLHRYP